MKRLIVCSDGTWNKPAQEDRDQVAPSNVYKMATAIAEKDPEGHRQVCFYDAGVGTHTTCVKVVDTFGCDTSITVEVTV